MGMAYKYISCVLFLLEFLKPADFLKVKKLKKMYMQKYLKFAD